MGYAGSRTSCSVSSLRTISTRRSRIRRTVQTGAIGKYGRAESLLRRRAPTRADGAPDRAVQAGTPRWPLARARAEASGQALKPATVNRELDTLRAVLSWAVKERKLIESPLVGVDRLHVDNRRIRVLTPAEQLALLGACQRRPKFAALLELLLITGARVGEFLALQWTEDHRDELHFLKTKNGQVRRVQVTTRMRELLDGLPRRGSYVFMNARTGKPYQTIRKVFERALERAGITTGDVTPHTLRHTAITRIVAAGVDDYTVMETVGHLTRDASAVHASGDGTAALSPGDIRSRAGGRGAR